MLLVTGDSNQFEVFDLTDLVLHGQKQNMIMAMIRTEEKPDQKFALLKTVTITKDSFIEITDGFVLLAQ